MFFVATSIFCSCMGASCHENVLRACRRCSALSGHGHCGHATGAMSHTAMRHTAIRHAAIRYTVVPAFYCCPPPPIVCVVCLFKLFVKLTCLLPMCNVYVAIPSPSSFLRFPIVADQRTAFDSRIMRTLAHSLSHQFLTRTH